MTEQPTSESRQLKVGALLTRPDRASVPGPPSKRPVARPGVAPGSEGEQTASAASIDPRAGGGTPRPAALVMAPAEGPPPTRPSEPAPAVAPARVPVASEQPPPSGVDLSLQVGKLRWETLVSEPTTAAVAARKVRKDQPKEQLNVGITFSLFHHMARHLEEHNLPKTDLVEALLRAWLAERGDPAPDVGAARCP